MPRIARFSPISIAVLIFGIIFLATLPPIGMILIVMAFVIQRRYRTEILAGRHASQARLIEKRKQERYAAALRFNRS